MPHDIPHSPRRGSVQTDRDSKSAVIIEAGWVVRRMTPNDPLYEAALQSAVVGTATQFLGSRHPAVSEFLSDVAEGPLRIDLVFGAWCNEQLAGSAVVVESPEGSGLVLIPCGAAAEEQLKGTRLALRSAVTAAWSGHLDLLEILVPPELTHLADALRFSGFRRLTELIYLSRSTELETPRESTKLSRQGLNWVTYSDTARALFCEAVRLSYVQSLDCPELTSIRTPEQAIASHRATGIHDPDLWFVAMQAGKPVAVLLLSRMRRQAAVEIVYMGVAQDARGTGVADALMIRALEAARSVSATYLALAMDVRNTPARSFYSRWGFARVGARCAWIATPDDKGVWDFA